MDDLKASRLRQRAIDSAACRGFEEQSEDFAHDVLVNYLEGKGKHQTIDQAVIDVIRKTYGRTWAKKGKGAFNHKLKSSSAKKLARIAAKEVQTDSVYDFERLIKPLKGTERAMACLYYEWGFNQHEIAHLFGFTVSFVSQTLSLALSRLKNKTT